MQCPHHKNKPQVRVHKGSKSVASVGGSRRGTGEGCSPSGRKDRAAQSSNSIMRKCVLFARWYKSVNDADHIFTARPKVKNKQSQVRAGMMASRLRTAVSHVIPAMTDHLEDEAG